MASSTFTKVGSLYRTTLKQGIASGATALEFNDTPFANIEYPNWFVLEPSSSNAEIIYCPTAPTGAAFTGVVRGINPAADVDTGDVAYQKGHAANVEVVLAPLHRQWNQLVDVMDGTTGTGDDTFRIGKDADDDIKIIAQNADLNKPFLIYDKTLNKWLISNDGVSTYDPSLGGSGLIAGLGTTINASAIDLDLRTSGGLRNNQGVGSKQADVDPTIVARLDTANTFTAVQTITAARLQITTDASASNDGVRKAFLDSSLDARITSAQATAVKSGPASDASEYHYHRPSQFYLDGYRANGGLFTTAADNNSNSTQACSSPDGSDIYIYQKTAAANNNRGISRYTRDTTGNYYATTNDVNTGVGSAAASQYAAICCGTTFVWTVQLNGAGTDILITRYNRDLTGATTMTISGTANTTALMRLCGNDSVLYCLASGSTTCAVYTISGTTATRGTDITLGDNASAVKAMYFDGTFIHYNTGAALKRYNTSGVVQANVARATANTLSFIIGYGYRTTTDYYVLAMRPIIAATPTNAILEGYALDMP